jgi:hypothetical protein
MFTTLSVQLPADTLLRLVERLKNRGGSQDLSEAITGAVESWLDGCSDSSHAQDGFGARGYQWHSRKKRQVGPCLFSCAAQVLRIRGGTSCTGGGQN